jgi:hypothetical protein
MHRHCASAPIAAGRLAGVAARTRHSLDRAAMIELARWPAAGGQLVAGCCGRRLREFEVRLNALLPGRPWRKSLRPALPRVEQFDRLRPLSRHNRTICQRRCEGRPCEGFRMTAPSRAHPRAPGPSSESLQGRNPREVGRNGAAGSMGIWTRSLKMRPLMTWRAERSRSRAMVATRLGSLGNRGPRPILALRDAGSDERCRGRPWTSETDRDSSGE